MLQDIEGKSPYHESTTPVVSKYAIDGIVDDDGSNPSLRHGETRNDQKDMHRMGKDQELMRMFRSFSTFSFTIMIQATWEFLLWSAWMPDRCDWN